MMRELSIKPFHEIFEEKAQEYSEYNAIYWGPAQSLERITYRMLNIRANQLANSLHKLWGPEKKVIAVCMAEHAYYIVSLLAIWKAGFIYMPLSAHVSEGDILRRLEMADCKYILLDSFSQQMIKNSQALYTINIDSDEQLRNDVNEQDLKITSTIQQDAYLMCSSGTTGLPKLIMCSFEGLPLRVNGILKYVELHTNDMVLGFSSLDFDASLMDIMVALSCGASICIVPFDIKQNINSEFVSYLSDIESKGLRLTYAALIPDVVEVLVKFCPFKYLITMGDMCRWCDIETLLKKGIIIFDGYGPTEATIAATMRKLTIEGQGLVNIFSGEGGLPGIELYINTIDKIISISELNRVDIPLPCSGEFILGGAGLGYYYKDKKELNKNKFITLNGNRLYRTGDLVELYDTGELKFLGRLDQCVKINGCFIELGAFENSLRYEYDYIKDVAVTKIDKTIVAYIVIKDELEIDDKKINQLYYLFKSWRVCIFCVSGIPKTERKGAPDYELLSKTSEKTFLIPKITAIKSQQIEEIEIQVKKIIIDILIPQSLKNTVNIEFLYEFDFPLQFIGLDSIATSYLVAELWNAFRRPGSSSETLPPLEFKKCILTANTCSDIAKAIGRYNYNVFSTMNKGESPGLFVLFTTEPSKYIKDVKQTVYNAELLQEFSLTIEEQAEDIARNIKSIQSAGPYHIAGIDIENTEKTNEVIYHIKKLFFQNEIIISNILNLDLLQKTHNKLSREYHENILQLARNKEINDAKYYFKNSLLEDCTNDTFLFIKLNDFLKNECQQTLFVFGEPGSGKTTVAKKVILDISNNDSDFFVFYLNLTGFSGKDNFLKKLLQTKQLENTTINFLLKKKVIFICDDYHLLARLDHLNLTKEIGSNIKFIVFSHPIFDQKSFLFSWGEDLPIYYLKNNLEVEFDDVPKFILESYNTRKDICLSPNNKMIYTCVKMAERVNAYFLNPEKLSVSFFVDFMNFIKWARVLIQSPVDLNYKNNWMVIDDSMREERENSLRFYSSQYFNYIKNMLYIAQTFEIKQRIFPAWLIQFSTLEQKELRDTLKKVLPSEVSPLINYAADHSLFFGKEPKDRYLWLSKKMLLEKCLNNANIQIFNQDGNFLPIFALYPLSGEIPDCYKELASFIGQHFPIIAFSYHEPKSNIMDCASYYANLIKDIYPSGPYILMGWSFGGLLSYLIAWVLEQRNEKVELVYTMDTPSPEKVNDIIFFERAKQVIKVMVTQIYPIKAELHSAFEEIFHSASIRNENDIWGVAITSLSKLAKEHLLNIEQLLFALKACEVNLHQNYTVLEHLKCLEGCRLKSRFVSVMASNSDKYVGNGAENFNWHHFVAQVESITIPGNHFTIFTEMLYQHIKQIVYRTVGFLTQISLDNKLKSIYTTEVMQLDDLTRFQQSVKSIDNEFDSSELIKKLILQLEYIGKSIIFTGDTGIGKTLFAKVFFRELVKQEVLSNKQSKRIPVYIDNTISTIDGFFNRRGFSEFEIAEIKEKRELIVFIDGLDECAKLDLTQWNIKNFILFVRKGVLPGFDIAKPYYFEMAKWMTVDNPKPSLLNEWQFFEISPFMVKIVNKYLESYHSKESYDSLLNKFPRLTSFLTNPLALSLIVTILNGQEGYTVIHTKTDLYENFFLSLMNTRKIAYRNEKGVPIVNEEIEVSFSNYMQELSYELQKGKDIFINDNYFCAKEPVTQFIRNLCPIENVNGQIRFTHISFQHFFVAKKMLNQLMKNDDDSLLKQYLEDDKIFILDFFCDLFLKNVYDYIIKNKSIKATWTGILTRLTTKCRYDANKILEVLHLVNIEKFLETKEELYDYALLLHEAGKDQEAIVYLDVSSQKLEPYNEKRYEILANLGTIFHQNSRYQEAENCFNQALHIQEIIENKDINVGYVYTSLGYLLYNSKNPYYNLTRAKEVLIRSVEEEVKYPYLLKTLRYVGWGYYHLGKIAVIENNLEEAKKNKFHFIRCISLHFGEKENWPAPYLKHLDEFDASIEQINKEHCINRPNSF